MNRLASRATSSQPRPNSEASLEANPQASLEANPSGSQSAIRRRRPRRGNRRRRSASRHRRLHRCRGHRDPGRPRRPHRGDQSLLTLESDKASMEIPSPIAGTVKALKVAVGDQDQPGFAAGHDRDRRRRGAKLPRRAAADRRSQPAMRNRPPEASAPEPGAANRHRVPPRRPSRQPPQRQQRSRSACPTSATSPISRSSRSWSRPATASTWISPF
jgi:hypothetical protein